MSFEIADRRSPRSATRGDGLLPDLAIVAASTAGLLVIGWLLGAEAPRRTPSERKSAVARLSISSGARRRPAGSLVWDDVLAPAPLAAGDALYVAPGGSARVALESGGVLEVEERSMIVLEFADSRAPRLELVRGALSGISGTTPLSVRARASEVVLAQGADARLAIADRGPSVELFGGAASIDARPVEAQPPSPLLSPPRNYRHWLVPGGPPLRLVWDALAGRGLTVEVARDREFREVVARGPGDAGSLRLAPPGPGAYFWRLSDGTAVRTEARGFTVLADARPTPLSPAGGEIVLVRPGERIPFAWTALDGVTSYRIEIARESEPSFDHAVVTNGSEAPRAWIALDLPEGGYRWRVVGSGPDRPDSASPPAAFRVAHRPLPDAPRNLDSVIEVERGDR